MRAADPIVVECRQVLGADPTAVDRLTHSVRATTTAGVYRVRAGGASAVVKVVTPRSADRSEASRRRRSFRYWRREERLLPSRLLGPYRSAGLRPPDLLATFRRGPDEVALWLEEATGSPGEAWALDRFGDLARRLGRAQGSLTGRARSAAPWLSRSFLRDYLDDTRSRVPYALLQDEDAWRHPLIADHVPGGLRAPLARLHAEQERFLAWVEGAPRTFAHLDLWPANLFAAGGGTGAVLIDWSFAGDGALGEDLGNLVPDSVWDLLHPAAILPDLDRTAFAAYLEGLREAGWDGDERHVRLAMCAAVVKYDWIAPVLVRDAAAADPVGYGGRPIGDRARFTAERGRALAFLAERADEARGLATRLGLDGGPHR